MIAEMSPAIGIQSVKNYIARNQVFERIGQILCDFQPLQPSI